MGNSINARARVALPPNRLTSSPSLESSTLARLLEQKSKDSLTACITFSLGSVSFVSIVGAVAPLMAEAMRRISDESSVSSLFD